MILCHKCAGVLTHAPDENMTALHGCRCISGWVRGFEPTLTRREAIAMQAHQALERALLFDWQGRNQAEVARELDVAIALERLYVQEMVGA